MKATLAILSVMASMGCRTAEPVDSGVKTLAPSVKSKSAAQMVFSGRCADVPIKEPRAQVTERGLTKCYSTNNPLDILAYVPSGKKMTISALAKEVIDKQCSAPQSPLGGTRLYSVTCEIDAGVEPNKYNFNLFTPTTTHNVTMDDLFPQGAQACSGGAEYFPPGTTPTTYACQATWNDFNGNTFTATMMAPAVNGAGYGMCELQSKLYKMIGSHGAPQGTVQSRCYKLSNTGSAAPAVSNIRKLTACDQQGACAEGEHIPHYAACSAIGPDGIATPELTLLDQGAFCYAGAELRRKICAAGKDASTYTETCSVGALPPNFPGTHPRPMNACGAFYACQQAKHVPPLATCAAVALKDGKVAENLVLYNQDNGCMAGAVLEKKICDAGGNPQDYTLSCAEGVFAAGQGPH